MPSWFKDLAQQEASQDIIEFATKSVSEGQPVVLCMNGKPANNIFRILIEKRAANVTKAHLVGPGSNACQILGDRIHRLHDERDVHA